MITLALSKGRILEDTLPMLKSMGIEPAGDIGRLLRVPTTAPDLQLVIIRPADVPTYVAYGAADLGVTGKDVLMEHGGEGLYEPLDLKIAGCRLSVAQVKDAPALPPHHRLRVATKYPESAREHFLSTGREAEVIKVNGSVELAPLTGLADGIVDLVATGRTLRENGLVEREQIFDSSARLVANRVSHKLRAAEIDALAGRLERAVGAAR